MSKIKVENEGKFVPRGYEDTFDMSESDLMALSAQIRADLAQDEADKEEWLQDKITDVKAYFGIKKQAEWPFKGAAKISSQMHRIMVDTTKANLLASATAPDNLVKADTNKSQTIESAKYLQDLHNALAQKEYMLPEVLDRSWHTSLIESFTVLKPVYSYEVSETLTTVKRWLPSDYSTEGLKYDLATDTVTTQEGQVVDALDINRIPEDPEELKSLGMKECEITVTKEHVKEGIKILSIPGSDIFIPISSPGETPFEKYQRASHVIHHEYKTVQEMQLLREQEKIKNFDMLEDSLALSVAHDELRELKEEQTGMIDFTKHIRKILRNIWWYGKFEYKGKLRELVVYMNYETGTILKVQVNKFGVRPFFPQVPFPVEGTPFGESEPKQIRSLVTELELMINTLINMGLIKAYPPKYYDPTGGFDPKTLGAVGPNSYIPVRDPSRNIFLPPQPEDPRVLMEMVKFVMDLIERATANSDTVQGQSAPTNSTKFEIQQKLVRAGVRFDMIYKRLKAQLSPMFSYINQLLLAHMPLEKEIELMGEQAVIKLEDGSEISRLHYIYQTEGDFGLTLSGNSVMEEQSKLEKAKELLQLAAMPPYNAYLSYKPESPYYLLFNLIQHYNPVAMDRILAKPEEVAQLLRDRQQVQNEQEQLAVEQGKQQGPSMEMQMQAQMMQMEMQLKTQQAQLDAAKKDQDMKMEAEKHMQDMKFKEQEHDQKLRQMAEAHQVKMELARKEANAKAKQKPASNN